MSEKHYTIDYLENTGLFLKKLKEHSYQPFLTTRGNILDLGCGTGLDVIRMSETLQVDKVFGIDHDPQMITKANSSKKADSNVEFILTESDKIPFESDYFSGIRAERLIQHLVNPQETINEVYRCLIKDNPFLIVETDWASLIIYDENVEIVNKLNKYLTVEKINNGYASRKLISYLNNSNFRNISIEVLPFILTNLKDANEYIWLEYIINEAFNNGFINDSERNTFISSLKKADDLKHFAISINMVIVTSYK